MKWYGEILRREEECVGKIESDGDGGAWEKKDMKTKADVVGYHQERLVGERIVRGGSSRPSSMEASDMNHRPHIKVGKDAEEEMILHVYNNC